ncbi:hypothetical protein QL285_050239 [Trifolium repens]|nr:hypothetical protein QL285_050239 [Trifolium repens]
MKVADELNMKIIEFQNNHVSIDELNGFLGKVKEIEVKGFKKKEGGKGRKRKKSWVEKQLPKRNKNGGTGASQSQEPAVNEGNKGSKSIKGQDKHKHTQRKKNDGSSVSQSQMQEASNASVPTWINDANHQPSMENNDTLSEFGVTSFTSLLMAQLDENITI